MRGKNLIEQCSKKCPNLSVAQFFCPQQWKEIWILPKTNWKKIVSRQKNLWNCFCQQMRTRELDELKCKSFSNMRLVGMVRRHCQSLSGQYLVFGVRREVSNCQIQVFDINKQVGSVWWSLLLLLHQNWIFKITSSSQEVGGGGGVTL